MFKEQVKAIVNILQENSGEENADILFAVEQALKDQEKYSATFIYYLKDLITRDDELQDFYDT